MKYKVYVIQGIEFNTLEIEANSQVEAINKYDALWTDGHSVYSIEYRDDKIEYFVESAPET
jgi:hypothetical protein